MRVGHALLSFFATLALVLIQAGSESSRANAQSPVALTGQVTSAEEGAMEGVLVSAKKAGSTITITVVSDAQGRYSFPAGKLAPGQYALRIRAVGYDLDNSKSVEVAAQKHHHARSQAAQDRGSRGAIVERRMAGQHSRHRSAERHPARVRRLSHP